MNLAGGGCAAIGQYNYSKNTFDFYRALQDTQKYQNQKFVEHLNFFSFFSDDDLALTCFKMSF